jgi:hypothetical protein
MPGLRDELLNDFSEFRPNLTLSTFLPFLTVSPAAGTGKKVCQSGTLKPKRPRPLG